MRNAQSSSYRDRTQEFHSIAETLKKSSSSSSSPLQSSQNGPSSSAVSQHPGNGSRSAHIQSEFNKRASKIGLGIHHTSQKLNKLTQLAKRRSVFDDPTLEIQQLTAVIKEDITALNSAVLDLQLLCNTQNESGNVSTDTSSHSTTVVDNLKNRLMTATKEFKEVLTTRTENLKVDVNRRQQYSVNASKESTNPFVRQRPINSAASESPDPPTWANGASSSSALIPRRFYCLISFLEKAFFKVSQMEETKAKGESIFSNVAYVLRKCFFGVLSMGPIPDHIAFIMDGNRRYAEKCNLEEGAGHKLGYSTLMSMLRYCYELNVKYVTIYAFSIDNFKRRPEEVQTLMDLIREKIEGLIKEGSLVNQYGVRVYFIGDLKLLDESVRLAAEKAMAATAGNSKAVLSICIAYTSTNEIMNAVQLSCEEKWDELKILDSCGAAYGLTKNFVDLVDVERNMFMKVAPSPDIIVRTSGESRLSNFLLWQSSRSILYSPSMLWPEIGLRHLGWAILKFQRYRSYLEKTKKRV